MQVFAAVSEYMPHGMCLLWQPWLLLLWAGSDVLIAIAYFAIPLALLKVVHARRDIRHRGLVLLFASFILLCGITHAVSVVTLWWPIYPAQGAIKLMTGIVSLTTAVVLFRLVPTLVALPSSRDLEQANERLREEVAKHEQTAALLRKAQADLEAKVEARTAELKDANTRFEVTAREAVHRSRNLIAVVSSLARQTMRTHVSLDSFREAFLGRLDALAKATALILESPAHVSTSLRAAVEKQLEPVLLSFPDSVSIAGPEIEIGQEAAQHLSLALHELATNAQKHGALLDPEGAVSVTWSLEAAPEGRQLVFRWEETPSRGPAGAAAEAEAEAAGDSAAGFGTHLLLNIVPSMLQGEARRHEDNTVFAYELRVAASAVQPPESLVGRGDAAGVPGARGGGWAQA